MSSCLTIWAEKGGGTRQKCLWEGVYVDAVECSLRWCCARASERWLTVDHGGGRDTGAELSRGGG